MHIPLEHVKNIYKVFRIFIFHWLKIDRIQMDLLFSQWKHLAFVSLVSLNISLAFLEYSNCDFSTCHHFHIIGDRDQVDEIKMM